MRNLFSPKKIIESLVLSLLIKEGPLHGYALTIAIEEKFGWKPSQTAIYNTLKSLGRQQAVTFEERVEKGRAQKIYSITEKGHNQMVNAKKEMVSVMGKRLSQMMSIMQDFSEMEDTNVSHDIQKCKEMSGKNMDLIPFYVFKLMHVAPEETRKILEATLVSLKDLAVQYKVNFEDIEKIGGHDTI